MLKMTNITQEMQINEEIILFYFTSPQYWDD